MRRFALTIIGLTVAALSVTGCQPTYPKIDYTAGELSGADPNWGTNMAGCLADAGWEVTVEPRGGILHSGSSVQAGSYEDAFATCEQEFGYDVPQPPLTTEQLKKVYQGRLALVGCLKENGYTVTEIPSEQSFVDFTGVLDPYGELTDPGRSGGAISDEEIVRLLKICPDP